MVVPQSVKGRIRRLKWLILVLTLGVYYIAPFLRWDRGPGEPSQAILLDLEHGRLYGFFVEIWPQELYYVTGLGSWPPQSSFWRMRLPAGYGAASLVRKRSGPISFCSSRDGSRATAATA